MRKNLPLHCSASAAWHSALRARLSSRLAARDLPRAMSRKGWGSL